ncbi:MAG: hypothetical protein WCA35_19680 [Kovacikia sp.]
MRNSLNRLKFLPWRSLWQAAGCTVLTVLVIELLVFGAIQSIPLIAAVIVPLLRPPLGILISYAISVGIGALAVVILERFYRPGISAGSLWALVLCLAIGFLLAGLLPLPTLLFQFEYYSLVLIVVGVFWKGRPYWQSFKRW